jgi:hypothetical protein
MTSIRPLCEEGRKGGDGGTRFYHPSLALPIKGRGPEEENLSDDLSLSRSYPKRLIPPLAPPFEGGGCLYGD